MPRVSPVPPSQIGEGRVGREPGGQRGRAEVRAAPGCAHRRRTSGRHATALVAVGGTPSVSTALQMPLLGQVARAVVGLRSSGSATVSSAAFHCQMLTRLSLWPMH